MLKRLLGVVLILSMILGGMVNGYPMTVSAAEGRTFYINSIDGDDANDGMSESSPWRSLEKVNGTTFLPGDKILFKAGGSWNGLLHPKGSGDANSQITIDKYGDGNKPIINGNGIRATVVLDSQEYWTIKNLEITNMGETFALRDGIMITAKDEGVSRNVQIIDCYIHDIDGSNVRDAAGAAMSMYWNAGIHVTCRGRSSATRKWDGVLIKNTTISNLKSSGIKVNQGIDWVDENGVAFAFHTNIVVQDCVVSDTGSDGIVFSNTVGAICERTQVLDPGTYGILEKTKLIAGIWMCSSDSTIIQNCEVARTRLFYNDGTAFDTDWGVGGIILHQYNYTHENEGGFFLDCSNVKNQPDYVKTILRYNLSVNDEDKIVRGAGGLPVEIYNNTFYNDKNNLDLVLEPNAGSVYKFYNNIFYLTKAPGWGKGDYRNNLYYNPNGSLSVPSSHVNPVYGDPKFANPGDMGDGMSFANSYKIAADSPAVDGGRTIADAGDTDFFGNSIEDVTPDIGFHEVGGKIFVLEVPNGDFEAGNQSWEFRNGSTVIDYNQYEGNRAGKLIGNGGAEMTLTGLKPNTTYRLRGYMKTEDASKRIALGAKYFGGVEVSSDVNSTEYQECQVDFTTGPSNTTARIYVYVPGSTVGYGDNVTIEEIGPVVYIPNGDFESGNSDWSFWNGSVVDNNQHAGNKAVKIVGMGNAEMTISGLKPSTTYRLTGYMKTEDPTKRIALGAKHFGGIEVSSDVNSTEYQKCEVDFTTSANSTSARIYIYIPGSTTGYGDSVTLREVTE